MNKTANRQKRMVMIFNEWVTRYAKNPEEFGNILNEDGSPVTDYGELCAEYFLRIESEMESTKLLPVE